MPGPGYTTKYNLIIRQARDASSFALRRVMRNCVQRMARRLYLHYGPAYAFIVARRDSFPVAVSSIAQRPAVPFKFDVDIRGNPPK